VVLLLPKFGLVVCVVIARCDYSQFAASTGTRTPDFKLNSHVLSVGPDRPGYTEAKGGQEFYRQLVARVQSLPGVKTAAVDELFAAQPRLLWKMV